MITRKTEHAVEELSSLVCRLIRCDQTIAAIRSGDKCTVRISDPEVICLNDEIKVEIIPLIEKHQVYLREKIADKQDEIRMLVGSKPLVPDCPDPPKPPARKIIFEVSCPACGLEWRVHHSDPNSGLDTRCRCVIPIPAKPANLKPEYKRAEVVVGVINNELWYGDKCVCEIERGQRCDLEAIAQQLNDCIKHKNDSIKYKKQYNRLSADL